MKRRRNGRRRLPRAELNRSGRWWHVPPTPMETVFVEGTQLSTGPLDELQVSRMKTSLVVPPPASDTWVLKQ